MWLSQGQIFCLNMALPVSRSQGIVVKCAAAIFFPTVDWVRFLEEATF